MNKVEIRSASPGNIEDISVCHRASFPDSLSSALGLTYVKRMLSWYLSSEDTFMFYLEVEGRCVGYCGGMVKRQLGVGSASSMAQFSFNAAVLSFLCRPWLLFHREVRIKYRFIVRNVFTRLLKKKGRALPSNTRIKPYAGLVVIGVHPDFHGRGYGSLLLDEFERIAIQKSLEKMALTVRADNQQAIKVYSKKGWTIDRTEGNSLSMSKMLG